NIWVVAFLACGCARQTRCDAGGRFAFRDLQPGTYGLHAGHEATRAFWHGADEGPRVADEGSEGPRVEGGGGGGGGGGRPDPWKEARIVDVADGETLRGLRLLLR